MGNPNIFVCGMPGSGKSTLGKKLADHLQLPFQDLDDLIESREQTTVRDIFRLKGEEHFRVAESETLKSFLYKTGEKQSSVLALGGGTPCFHNHMELINSNGVSLFLDTPLTLIKERMLSDNEILKRPLMAKAGISGIASELECKYKDRLPYYEKASIKIRGDESLTFISSLITSFIGL